MNSKIILVKDIHIDRDYTNVLSYTETQMLNLCRSQNHLIAEANDYSFLRPTGSIMAGFTYSECLQANYIAFQNPDYNNKWFFAWIDDVVYKGDRNTEITFTIDAWSTWFDYWQPKSCFVVREHVNDDIVGLHTVPENLDVGEVIQESQSEDYTYKNASGYWLCIASNWTIKDNSDGSGILPSDKGMQTSGISVYDNTVFGTKLFIFNITQLTSFIDVVNFLIRTNADGHIEDVQNIFVMPYGVIDQNFLEQHTAQITQGGASFSWYTLGYDMNAMKFNTTINKRRSFSDYTPKNRKMLCLSI